MSFGCGSCNLCCKLLEIRDIQKPARIWCWHALRPHGGCAVHNLGKPEVCASWQCLWLNSQSRVDPNDKMPWELRPNNSYVVFGPWDQEDETKLFVHVDPEHPQAWQSLAVQHQLELIRRRGGKIEVVIGENHVELEPLEPLA